MNKNELKEDIKGTIHELNCVLKYIDSDNWTKAGEAINVADALLSHGLKYIDKQLKLEQEV